MLKKIFILLLGIFCMKTSHGQIDQQVIILLGAPGAGKGTHAIEMSKKFHYPQISTGDLFRENLSKNTALGKKAKGFIEKGELVPDELVIDMLFDRISKPDCEKGYILDGFPRTVSQAKSFEKRLDKSKLIVLYIKVSDDKLIERITGRLNCPKCGTLYHEIFLPPKNDKLCDTCHVSLIKRKDDTEEVVKKRLCVFHEQTEPVIEYYKNKYMEVNGEVKKEMVYQNLLDALKKA